MSDVIISFQMPKLDSVTNTILMFSSTCLQNEVILKNGGMKRIFLKDACI